MDGHRFTVHVVADQTPQGSSAHPIAGARDLSGPIEIAVFLSPSLVSRRLGYLQAREGWTNDQLETRWQLARETLGGRLSFLVRVCSFPKIDLLEEAPAENGPIGQLTPVLVVDGEKGFPLESIVLEDRHGFDTEDVLTPWTSNPRLASFMGAKDELYVPSPVNGDLEAETLLLQAPSIPVRSLSVVLSSHGKTRQADFSPIDPGLPTRRHR